MDTLKKKIRFLGKEFFIDKNSNFTWKGSDGALYAASNQEGIDELGYTEEEPDPRHLPIGTIVHLNMYPSGELENCRIIKAHISSNKKQYDLEVPVLDGATRIYNVDSKFLYYEVK